MSMCNPIECLGILQLFEPLKYTQVQMEGGLYWKNALCTD